MKPIRKINKTEIGVLEYLMKKASIQLRNDWSNNLFIQQLDDGGMGGFLIFESKDGTDAKRKFGKQVSEFEFTDDDGVLVLVSLNVDQNNQPFEVDIWKTNFDPVIKLKIPPL